MRSTRIVTVAALLAGVAAIGLLAAPPAAARVVVGVGVGVPIYPYPYPYYYPPPPVYYAPPPVYYAPPPPVVYQSPPPAYMTPPAPAYSAPPAAAAPPSGNCREYTAQTMIAGQPQQTVGTACLQPDGTWRIMN
ncbi:MAG: hypothetical protein HY060_20405 [Proteobacteria bacterium]|nr:hypothetical protein [Pseudomonadota bacterium]